ncbi:PH domain-containing protein [Mucilaginibacter ginkgonis]|uniref:PH domain-containing protein n=1 Tax=Mucilaginibacter ginkgonis TaxID=2682091 RepID=A0A7T7JHL7_9SPHI|nr:PH domain-containing protein [Mucilaginibacter ginkgonis]QQL50678.1 PH domain-containing protein [Mucilaginibacter ginkgonis]
MVITLSMIGFTRYTIDGMNLNVRCGILINKNIDINTITRITENNGFLSAPALSSDRIEVFYNRYDSVVISPKNKKLFAEHLKQINPIIVVES